VLRGLLDRLRLGSRPPWRKVLPYQPTRDIQAPGVPSVADVAARLRHGTEFTRTPTSMYLTPAGLARSPLGFLRERYPDDAGLKLLTTPVDGAAGDMLLTADLLHLSELGPRVYDLARLRLGRDAAAAFVVRHVDGRPPEQAEWDAALHRLRRLEERAVIRPRSDAGWTDAAFQHAGAHAVARVTAEGRLCWDGFEHLALDDYEPFLEHLALSATGDTQLASMEGRRQHYLYQSVPGVRLPAKRRVEDRIEILRDVMGAMGVSLADRLVLDIGCNLGMAMAHYLHLGARWSHGWDIPVIVPHAERMLLALGCTRFSMTTGRIDTNQPVEGDVPAFIRPALRGCAVSYLAMRAHVGWLEALGRIPWGILLYEGQKSESEAQLDGFLNDLRRLTGFTRGPIRFYREDRQSRSRPITVLVRPEWV
jgi:hypothetical protein